MRSDPDRITAKLAALHFYQLAIPAPRSADADNGFDFQAKRGKLIFNGKAQCALCHVPPLFTEPGFNMHSAAEMGIDDFQAKRSPAGLYRTAPLTLGRRSGFLTRYPVRATVMTIQQRRGPG